MATMPMAIILLLPPQKGRGKEEIKKVLI